MAKIHTLKITNFRGIANFEQVFGFSEFICIIGRGDSGKSTILEAISYVLCGSWNLQFYDSDFHGCNVETSIEIEVTVYDLPPRLLQEDKYGLYVRVIDESTNQIHDNIEDSQRECLTIRLTVEKDLEPKWCVVNGRQEPLEIKASDRACLEMFMVSDFIDRHFSWNQGSPLHSLLKKESGKSIQGNEAIIEALREAKDKIDDSPFTQLSPIITKIENSASMLGVEITDIKTTIDSRDLTFKDGRVCLHQDGLPIRLKGKGSKRLISIAIQSELSQSGGIMLIDEIEQGLEPDRAQHLAKTLRDINKGQIFITTHSRDVLVELSAENLFKMAKNDTKLFQFDSTLQPVLRANPEAFFAKRVLICEGETEVGILRALNTYRISNGQDNASIKGVRFATGKGSNQIKYAEGFLKAGYQVSIFCDSDDEEVHQKKSELRGKGITIIDCEDNFSIEQQIFKDLPWDAVKGLVNHQITLLGGSLMDSVKARYQPFGTLESNWLDIENNDIRHVLGETAKKKSWFKTISLGELLGTTCCDSLINMGDNRLKQQLEGMSNWIDND
ncbi:ATP-dependent nuclease [Rufibacter hautae]|uniref:AAA family ATPase n=1 Tax=Rufibacter hautae TaxID=2595005 RepID=A0A5B6TKX4_9BACT|nr:ATP-binding protein [Rufibacter hautae]KAA3436742.1 AAA family ATPase [Rufibacter hautae]